MTQGMFARYTTKEHAHVLRSFPELMSGGLVFIKETYEEASAAAAHSVLRTLAYTGITDPIRVVYHPHNEKSSDPMDLIGSWGWKTYPQNQSPRVFEALKSYLSALR